MYVLLLKSTSIDLANFCDFSGDPYTLLSNIRDGCFFANRASCKLEFNLNLPNSCDSISSFAKRCKRQALLLCLGLGIFNGFQAQLGMAALILM